jgi:glycosyltransferase involved in cell wall biosynthesis
MSAPLLSGFSFIRNGVSLDYPFVEAYRSILPLVDELVVAVGDSTDGTREALEALNASLPIPKLRLVDTVWDDSLRSGGRILAQQTDVALSHVRSPWAFYIQADEVLHERYHATVRHALAQADNAPRCEGLLFDYRHFYGSYQYVGASRRWYRAEVRIVRRQLGLFSYRDAQGFRIREADGSERKLRVRRAEADGQRAEIYHYGWVRDPEAQLRKQQAFHRLWHDDAAAEAIIRPHVNAQADAYDYQTVDTLEPFPGTHPAVMAERIARRQWAFSYDPAEAARHQPLKHRLSNAVERLTGWRPGEYRNYRPLR